MIGSQECGRAGETQGRLEVALAPLRERLVAHPVYASLRDERTVRIFMEAHVFAVWDFQSLLTALQRVLTCVRVPWLPTRDPEVRRWVNQIVLDEESDEAPAGGYLSHFEIYLQAMRECGANEEPIQAFVSCLRTGVSVDAALDRCSLPRGVRPFVNATMAIARSAQPHCVAAAFAYGREDVIPAMFRQLVDRLAAISPRAWTTLRYYLDRHIVQDSGQHGPQAGMLVGKLCGSDETLWSQALGAARTSLEARARLWDVITASLVGR